MVKWLPVLLFQVKLEEIFEPIFFKFALNNRIAYFLFFPWFKIFQTVFQIYFNHRRKIFQLKTISAIFSGVSLTIRIDFLKENDPTPDMVVRYFVFYISATLYLTSISYFAFNVSDFFLTSSFEITVLFYITFVKTMVHEVTIFFKKFYGLLKLYFKL